MSEEQPVRRISSDDLPDIPIPSGPQPELNGEVEGEQKERIFALLLDEFLSEEFPSSPPQLGTEEETILPAGGLAVLAGMPSVGKTTLALDAIFHLASGAEWLGIEVERPLNVLIIENEGPQRKFQEKLRTKAEHWNEEIEGRVAITIWNWGSFSLADSEDVNALTNYLETESIDLVVGDPLDTLGAQGVGSPEDTRAFVQLLVPLGLTRTTSFMFLHHFRKEVTASEIHQVSGAWGGRLDTLMVLKETDRPDELRLSFPKLRWAPEKQPLILGKVRNTASFEVLAEEAHEVVDEDSAEAMLIEIVAALRKSSEPVMQRTSLALRVESAPTNRTFQRALRMGFDRNLLAKSQDGRKVAYSLTEASW